MHSNKKSIKLIEHILLIILMISIVLISCHILQITHLGYSDPEYSESGYLVKKITESSFHYEFNEDMTYGCPEFKEEYYFTVLVDDTYIKFKVPYEASESLHLGDHITVSRRPSKYFKHKYTDYKVVVFDIEVPAVIVVN